jgi:hypothetical protein
MSIRPAFSLWPTYNARLRDAVANLTPEQVLLAPGPGRWPLWAVVGHLACQRVFWICEFAGEPGVEATPFPDSGNNCPGDDDLVNVLSPQELAAALDSTFAIVERCLDSWTLATLVEEVRREWPGQARVHPRGWVLQRVFAHDLSHISEVNETLSRYGLPQVNLWS